MNLWLKELSSDTCSFGGDNEVNLTLEKRPYVLLYLSL